MANGRKPDPNQLSLTDDQHYQRRQEEQLEKHERRALIRAVTLERVKKVKPDMTRTRWRNAVEVLQYLASLDYGLKFPKQSTIAEAIGISTRTVKRAIADLVALEILASDKRGPRPNVYATDYWRLSSLGAGECEQNDGLSCPQSGANLAPQKGQDGPASSRSLGINPIKPSLTGGDGQRHGDKRRNRRPIDPRRGF
jgi:hypothetical protein